MLCSCLALSYPPCLIAESVYVRTKRKIIRGTKSGKSLLMVAPDGLNIVGALYQCLWGKQFKLDS